MFKLTIEPSGEAPADVLSGVGDMLCAVAGVIADPMPLGEREKAGALTLLAAIAGGLDGIGDKLEWKNDSKEKHSREDKAAAEFRRRPPISGDVANNLEVIKNIVGPPKGDPLDPEYLSRVARAAIKVVK